MTEKAPDSIASGNAKNEPINQQGSHGASHARANAEIHDRIGLFLGIVALVVSVSTATYVSVKIDALKDEVREIKGALHGP